ncbi:MAG: GDSL family lipase [Lachnospiraceae bacterium]|nr:GDSL family lipase [Lachnospiraceae bacterium]
MLTTTINYKADETNVKICGRTVYRDGIRYIGYSGSGIEFIIEGSAARVMLVTDDSVRPSFHKANIGVYAWEVDENNNITRQLDLGGEFKDKRIVVTEEKKLYTLVKCDEKKRLLIKIMKYSEPEYAICGIKEIVTDSEVMIPAPSKAHRIEFIGDSITCGYGVDGNLQLMEHRTEDENPCKSYSLTTVRAFDADVNVVAWNGKGIISGYIGDELEKKDESWLMPMLYKYTDGGLFRDYFKEDKATWEKWDFSKYSPELIIIYLGTNDCSYTRSMESRNDEFCEGYVNFLKYVRSKNQAAKILCIFGTMDDRLNDTTVKAVNAYKNETGDNEIYYKELPHQLEEDGYGTFWHPTPVSHKKAAEVVIKEVEEIMGWERVDS